MDDLIQPSFQTRPYHLKDVVFIRDRYQSFLYLKHHAKPMDMYIDPNTEDWVMVFKKTETKELYEKYRRFELE